jgi:hypothetical protein
MNPPTSFLRLAACLAVFSPWMAPGGPAITAQPASVAVTFPVPLPTTDLSESRFLGAYLAFTPLPGPYPPGFPTQRDVLMSRTGNGYTGLGTSGPWFYRSLTNGGAGITFFVNEDGGRIYFYRDYILQTNGTYQVFSRNSDDESVLIQAGTYQMFDYEGPTSRVTAMFSVAVNNPESTSFQWYFDGVPLEDGVSSPFIYYFESVVPPGQTTISGSQTAMLSISNVTRLNAGSYHCVVTSPSGSVTSAVATLTVNGHDARDLTPPTVQITAPEQDRYVGTDPVHAIYISGTAGDDTAVGSVFLLFGTNHYGPMPMGPKGDSMRDSLWWGYVYLAPGSNYLGAYAVDAYGNRSSTNSRVMYYQSNSFPTEIVMHLFVEGGGVVTPLTNGQMILSGQLYELRAAPFPGYHFDHWSGSPFIEGNNPVISFFAQDGLSFTAHFALNPVTNPPAPPRPGLLTFDTLTNASHGFPIFGPDGDDLGRLMFTGPYVTLPTGWNPNNGTPALLLDSSAGSNYVVTLSGIRAPFALKGFDVVSVSGSFTLTDTTTGARYEHDGSIGHVSLGKAFRRSVYVDLVVNGQVVLDNIEYRLLEHAPVARIKVWNELKLPPIDAEGHTLFNDSPPSHLEDDSSFYQYPGYKGFWHYLLAPGTNSIPFVLDASASRDSDGDALKFSWEYYVGGDEGDFYPLAGGVASRSPFYVNRPPVLGNSARHQVIVTVGDGYLIDRLWFGVVVLRPQDAANFMSDWLEEHFDGDNDPQGVVRGRLIPILRESEAEFSAGQTQAGRRSLRQFEHLAKVHLRSLDPMATHALLVFTGAVLDVTKKSAQ